MAEFAPGQGVPPPQTASFKDDLSQEYKVLADFMADEAGKNREADRFYEKSRDAAQGEEISPELVEKHAVPPFAVHDLMQARHTLIEAIKLANVPDNAKMLAMAQAKYDCWIMFQPYYKSPKDYIGCREAFHQAMALVDMSKRKSVAAVASERAFTISFEDEVVVLNQKSRNMIARIAEAALESEEAVVILTGHSKTKVTIEDTINNSVRRIIAVRNALYQNGVDPDLVKIEFERGGSALDVDIELQGGSKASS